MEKDDNRLSDILGAMLLLYAVSTQAMTVYFWWCYSKEDSFLMTILVDPLLAELKGLLWPFFL